MEYIFRVSDPVGRMTACGLPNSLAVPFWREVSKWVEHSGPAWTVARLKSLKTDLIRRQDGKSPLTFVRKNRKGQWYGVLGAMFRYSDRSRKSFRAVLTAFLVYTGFLPKGPTAEHLDSLEKSLGAKPTWIPPDLTSMVLEEAREWLGVLVPAECDNSLLSYQGTPATRSPVFQGPSVNSDTNLEAEMYFVVSPDGHVDFDHPHVSFLKRFRKLYLPVFKGLSTCGELAPIFFSAAPPDTDIPPIWGGRVSGLTKDGGWKIRWIANPGRLHQLALKPLGLALFQALRRLPWDCTFDQKRAIPFIQQALKEGRTVHSVDLSSATDYFPLELQLAVLTGLFPHDALHLELFEALSRSSWTSSFGSLQWTRGQPMGLYPSFPAFALTHGMLVAALARVYHNQFFILGDDIVILDDSLAYQYKRALDLLECPHSPAKSIVSSRLAEFAGMVITAEEIFPQYKWKPVSDDSFLDFARAYGRRFAEKILTPEQRSVYRKVAELLPPLGCGHSKAAGKPLAERVLQTEEFQDQKGSRKGRKFHVSFLGWLKRLVAAWPARLYSYVSYVELERRAREFDKNLSASSTRALLPLLSEDLTDVFDLRDIVPDLPALGTGESYAARKTTLQRYSEWLQNYRPS